MLSTESGFSETVYFEAAQERITTANHLLRARPPDYVLATYVAGVAVECLLNAYRMRASVEDTARHDLRRLADLGGFYDNMKRGQKEAVASLLGEVVARWQNNHRYRSEESLRFYIVQKRLFSVAGYSTTRADAVAFSAVQTVEAATEIISVGVTRW